MDVAWPILHSQDMARLGHMRQDRIIRGILAMMRIKSSISPRHSGSGRNHTAINIKGQTCQGLLLNRFPDNLTVDLYQRHHRLVRKAL